MPRYVFRGGALDPKADASFSDGEHAGATADKYIRDMVFLATVLCLVAVGALLLVFSVIGPPGRLRVV